MDDWVTGMQAHFPMRSKDELFSYEFVEMADSGEMNAVLRAIVFESDGDSRYIRDIKEQVVNCGSRAHFDDPQRYFSFIRALREIISHCDVEAFESAMPSDLMPADALDLAKAKNENDFLHALSAKSRLGGFLSNDGSS